MNTSKNVFPVLKLIYGQGSRNASSLPVTPRFGKMKNKQVRFGVEDHTPVHVKNGVADNLLVQLTWALGITGAAWGLQTFYNVVVGNTD